MFVFQNDKTVGKQNRLFPDDEVARDSLSQTYDSYAREKQTSCFHATSPLNISASTSYSTELSSFSLHSDDSGSSFDSSEDDASVSHRLTLSNVLYKPTFDSPVDRLVRATNPETPKRSAMDTFHKLQTWVLEATVEEIQTYSWELQHQAVPELLEFIRVHVDDKECVLEALVLLQTLAFLPNQADDTKPGSLNALLLIDAQAITVLVHALLSHNNHSSPSTTRKDDVNSSHFIALQAQQVTCLFQRLWTFLMEIVLCPSAVDYFQRCDDRERRMHTKQQKHHQRMRLVTAIDLCLDRMMLSAFSVHATSTYDHHQYWMDQIFETLAMLLRIKNSNGELQPNDDIRLVLWEKNIVLKCQKIMADRIDAAAWESFSGFEDETPRQEATANTPEDEEHLYLQALSIFELCQRDREDGLSESMDARALEKFVYRTLPLFGHSKAIQTKGCRILDELASKHACHETAMPLANKPTTGNNSEKVPKTKIHNDTTEQDFSFYDLATKLFQKPCLCHNFQDVQKDFDSKSS